MRGDSGHYKVFIKNKENWFEFNDETVKNVNFDYVRKMTYGGKEQIQTVDLNKFAIKTIKK